MHAALAVARQHIEAAAARDLAEFRVMHKSALLAIETYRAELAVLNLKLPEAKNANDIITELSDQLIAIRAELATVKAERDEARKRADALDEHYKYEQQKLCEARASRDALRTALEGANRENAALAADQCHAGYGDDYGNHRCKEIDAALSEGTIEGLRIARELVSARAMDYAAAANKHDGTELGVVHTDKCGVCASLESAISARIAAIRKALHNEHKN